MKLRHLALATSVAAVGLYAFKRFSSGVSLPDDGSEAPDTTRLDQAGMPSGVHRDANPGQPRVARTAQPAS